MTGGGGGGLGGLGRFGGTGVPFEPDLAFAPFFLPLANGGRGAGNNGLREDSVDVGVDDRKGEDPRDSGDDDLRSLRLEEDRTEDSRNLDGILDWEPD